MSDLSYYYLDETYADDKISDAKRNLNFLMTTIKGTLPLNREFGLSLLYTDKAASEAKAIFNAELVKSAKTFMPEITIKSINWLPSEDSDIIIPKLEVEYNNAEEY